MVALFRWPFCSRDVALSFKKIRRGPFQNKIYYDNYDNYDNYDTSCAVCKERTLAAKLFREILARRLTGKLNRGMHGATLISDQLASEVCSIMWHFEQKALVRFCTDSEI